MAATAETYKTWPIPKVFREKAVERISSAISAVSFFKNQAVVIDSSRADTLAPKIESHAFEAANTKSEADSLPPVEAIKLYVREASNGILSAISESLKGSSPGEKTFDISGGKREFLSKQRAEELFEDLLKPNNGYIKIILSSKSFGPEAATVASRAIANAKATLKHADISDIIAGQKENDALAALTEICTALEACQLLSLDLSNNALGEKGVRAAGNALKGQTSLQSLSFCNNGISKEAAMAIAEILPSTPSLKTLKFHNNMSGDPGALALAPLVASAARSSLTHFKFSSTRVGTEGGIALANAIANGSSLQIVDLRDNMFGPEGGLALGQALAKHRDSICEILLTDTGFGDEGVVAFFKGLGKGLPLLEVLELGGSDITWKSAPSLADFIAECTGLKRLNLGENELGDRGAIVIAQKISPAHSSLEELDLITNELTRAGAVAAAHAVKNLPGFKKLNLNGNSISEAGIDEVRYVLASGAAGSDVLGPLDENDEESIAGGNDDDEEEEEEEDSDVADSGLDRKLESMAI